MWRIACVLCLLLLAACAETYGAAGTGGRILLGGGYRDRQIDAQSWEVDYSGAATDGAWVRNSALYRAAEIAQREGFPYFTTMPVSERLVPVYSGYRFVGHQLYVTISTRGWRAYEDRCRSGKVIGTNASCDLYDTNGTLASLSG